MFVGGEWFKQLDSHLKRLGPMVTRVELYDSLASFSRQIRVWIELQGKTRYVAYEISQRHNHQFGEYSEYHDIRQQLSNAVREACDEILKEAG